MSRILLVEDEPSLRDGLVFNLEAEGYQLSAFSDAESAFNEIQLAQTPFDLFIFDVMLPKMSGISLLKKLRENKIFTPCLLLTAKGRSQDILEGFQAGTDDYVTKPFDLAVFLARVHGLLRRKNWLNEPHSLSTFELDGRKIDFNILKINFDSHSTTLTSMEAEVLRFLILNKGKTVSRKELLARVWKIHANTDTRAIDNFIVRIRRALHDDPNQPKYLKTVRGIGYRLEWH